MKPPAFQFYPADFLSDENVVLMTNQEIGCYIKLICFCWKQGSIPKEMKKIAHLCGENELIMTELWPNIEPCFRSKGNGRLYHPRLARERAKQDSWRKRCIAGGKKSAEAKAAKARQQREEARVVQPENKFYLKGRSTLQSSSSFISSSIKKKKKEIYKRKKIFSPPSEKEVVDYFKINGYSEDAAKRAHEYYSIAGWVDAKGSPVKNWKQKMIGVWFKDENKNKEGNEEWRISNKSDEWLLKHGITP